VHPSGRPVRILLITCRPSGDILKSSAAIGEERDAGIARQRSSQTREFTPGRMLPSRCLCLRFAARLTACRARLEARIESLLLSLGLSHPLQHACLSWRSSPALPVSASPAIAEYHGLQQFQVKGDPPTSPARGHFYSALTNEAPRLTPFPADEIIRRSNNTGTIQVESNFGPATKIRFAREVACSV
jgi:hypothetical protein